MNVLAYDYSGYGWSDGKATEAALYADIRRVVAFAVNELKVPPYKIILVPRTLNRQLLNPKL